MARTPEPVEVFDVERRDKTLSVYVDEVTEESIEILKDWLNARSKAEVARQALRIGLSHLPAYDEALRQARERVAERRAQASVPARS